MNDIERLYNDFVVLLSSSWENGFLKVRPIDTKGRIIKLEFRRRDLTPEGEKYFFRSVISSFYIQIGRQRHLLKN